MYILKKVRIFKYFAVLFYSFSICDPFPFHLLVKHCYHRRGVTTENEFVYGFSYLNHLFTTIIIISLPKNIINWVIDSIPIECSIAYHFLFKTLDEVSHTRFVICFHCQLCCSYCSRSPFFFLFLLSFSYLFRATSELFGRH